MRLTLLTPPTTVLLALADAKAHLRVEVSEEDALIEALVAAATGAVERETGRQLLTATYRATLEQFPCWSQQPIVLPRAPLQSVGSVKYTDGSGVEQTWDPSEYIVETFAEPTAEPGRLYPAFTKTYPTTARLPGAVRIEFTAGYGAPADVPPELRAAALQWVESWYRVRGLLAEDGMPERIPATADVLLTPFRLLTAVVA